MIAAVIVKRAHAQACTSMKARTHAQHTESTSTDVFEDNVLVEDLDGIELAARFVP